MIAIFQAEISICGFEFSSLSLHANELSVFRKKKCVMYEKAKTDGTAIM